MHWRRHCSRLTMSFASEVKTSMQFYDWLRCFRWSSDLVEKSFDLLFILADQFIREEEWVLLHDESTRLNWLLSQVSSWYFELESRSSWIAHIFNLIQVELLILSTWCNSTRLKIESIQLNSSRTQAWCQKS